MSIECRECEADLRGGHAPGCRHYKPTEPKTIAVSCCAECPWLVNDSGRVLNPNICGAPGAPEASGMNYTLYDLRTRPSWCPLPITVKAEG